MNPVTDSTMSDLHTRTLDKQHYLEDLGYTYKYIWECDFDRQCRADNCVKTFVDALDMIYPLEPRDKFYGGRTENFTMYAEAVG